MFKLHLMGFLLAAVCWQQCWLLHGGSSSTLVVVSVSCLLTITWAWIRSFCPSNFFLKGIPHKLWHWTQQTPRKIPSPDALHFIIHGRSPVNTSCIRLVVYQFLLNVMHMANKMMGNNFQTTFFWFTKIAILFRKKHHIHFSPLKSWEPTIIFMLCSP